MELKGNVEQAEATLVLNFGGSNQLTLQTSNTGSVTVKLPATAVLIAGISSGGDDTKVAQFNTSGATTGTTLSIKTLQTTNRSVIIPNATDNDQIITSTTTQTLSSKTLTAPLITTNGSIDVSAAGTLTIGATATTLTLGGSGTTVSIAGSVASGAVLIEPKIKRSGGTFTIKLRPDAAQPSDVTFDFLSGNNRAIAIGGDVSIGGAFSTGGSFSITGNTAITGSLSAPASLTFGGAVTTAGNFNVLLGALTINANAVGSTLNLSSGDLTLAYTAGNTLTIPAGGGTAVVTTLAQTVTNKNLASSTNTLTGATAASFTNTGTISLPTTTTTLIGTAETATVTGAKQFTSDALRVTDGSNYVALVGAPSASTNRTLTLQMRASTTFTLEGPLALLGAQGVTFNSLGTNQQVNIPTGWALGNDTIVGNDTTATLTAKTLTNPLITAGGTIDTATGGTLGIGTVTATTITIGRTGQSLVLPGTLTLTTPKINDTSSTNTYNFAVNELTADRAITLPLLTGNDTFVFEAHTQPLTNKSMSGSANTFTNIPLATAVSGVLDASLGGTGVANNTAATLTRSGNFALTLTLSALTSATLPSGTITLVDLSSSQSLTTKNLASSTNTLTGATAASFTNTGTISLPTTTTTLIGTAETATVTGAKTFVDNAFVLADNGDNTKKLAFECSTIATGTTRTITAPDASGLAVVGSSANDNTSGTAASLSLPTTSVIRLTNASLVSVNNIVLSTFSQWLVIENRTGVSVSFVNDSGGTATNRLLTGTGADLTVANNAAIFLIYDLSTQRWQIVGGSGGSGSGWTQTAIKTATTYTAANNEEVPVDTGSVPNAITVTLPSSPTAGYRVRIIDVDFTASAYNITIAPASGDKLHGVANQTYVIASDGGAVEAVFTNSGNYGWRILKFG